MRRPFVYWTDRVRVGKCLYLMESILLPMLSWHSFDIGYDYVFPINHKGDHDDDLSNDHDNQAHNRLEHNHHQLSAREHCNQILHHVRGFLFPNGLQYHNRAAPIR